MAKQTLFLFLACMLGKISFGQDTGKPERAVSLVFGLNQPIVMNGFNFEVDYWTKKFVFDYSHGFGLEFGDNLVSEEAKAQNLNFNVSHSVGIGVGYRITEGFNLRVEPKLHVWQMFYNNGFKNMNSMIHEYSTFTLGLGAYYRWLPFQNKDGFLKGLTVAPSARWWPNVASSLDGDQYAYFNTVTQKNEIHHANKIGMSNTPFFVNVSVGYTFMKKH